MYSIKLKAEVKSKPGETVVNPHTPETLKKDKSDISKRSPTFEEANSHQAYFLYEYKVE